MIFIHHRDTPNVGDLSCSPADYFDFGSGEIRREHCKKLPEIHHDDVIVGGGSINAMVFREVAKANARFRVAYGVRGPNNEARPFLDRFDLVGLREQNHPWIDDKKYFFVPCVSCMSPLFDRTYEARWKAVFYKHWRKTTPELEEKLCGLPTLSNWCSSMEKAIEFMAGAEIVISNSYHGVYWATLLGKKVVAIPFNDKFQGYIREPRYLDHEHAEHALTEGENAIRHDDALTVARKANLIFYQRVMERLKEEKPLESILTRMQRRYLL